MRRWRFTGEILPLEVSLHDELTRLLTALGNHVVDQKRPRKLVGARFKPFRQTRPGGGKISLPGPKGRGGPTSKFC
jgi:hypothetical protein